MKIFFIVTASIELGAGLGFLCLPSMATVLLTGTPLEIPAALVVARIGGAGLMALGVACWLTREERQGHAARGLATAMLFYNMAAAAILAFAGVGHGCRGILIWPAVMLHSVMTVWCIKCLRNKSTIHH